MTRYKVIRASILAYVLLSTGACSLAGLLNPFKSGPSFSASTAIQKGDNRLYDGTTRGVGNTARNNQQVVNGASKVSITQGINPLWTIFSLMGVIGGLLFLLGWALERPKRRKT